jgi:hypothetical protein
MLKSFNEIDYETGDADHSNILEDSYTQYTKQKSDKSKNPALAK